MNIVNIGLTDRCGGSPSGHRQESISFRRESQIGPYTKLITRKPLDLTGDSKDVSPSHGRHDPQSAFSRQPPRPKNQVPHQTCTQRGAESSPQWLPYDMYSPTNSVGVHTGISTPPNPDLSLVTITSIFATDAHSYCMASSKSDICESIAQSTDPFVTDRTSNILRSVLNLFGNSSLPTNFRNT